MQSATTSPIHQILEEKIFTDLHLYQRLEHYFPKISDLFEKLYLHHPKPRNKEITRNFLENF